MLMLGYDICQNSQEGNYSRGAYSRSYFTFILQMSPSLKIGFSNYSMIILGNEDHKYSMKKGRHISATSFYFIPCTPET
jgi:hypothetical protein